MELLDCFTCGPSNLFIYGNHNGPNTWHLEYPECKGSQQSPINIVSRSSTVLTPSEPLRWCNYNHEPLSIKLCNDGNKVIILGEWMDKSRPSIQGGPLKNIYDFISAEFRWGPADDEGSEHSIDYIRYPMELQVIHRERVIKSQACDVKTGLAIISYFFQTTNVDNPYLDHVVTNLWNITNPGSSICIPLFPLEWLFPKFENKYYMYNGSLTHPPCSEIVTWIIYPEPIAMSTQQLAQFRKICSIEGPILSNSRPVQKVNDRSIFFYA